METILNEMETLHPKTELIPYSVPDVLEEIDTDFIKSMDLGILENGIKHIGRAMDVLSLAQGVAIVKIESEGLWKQAGFPNLRAYRIEQNERLGIPRSTISHRRTTAEIWLKYRKALGKVDLTGKISSLIFFDDAVVRHGLKEALAGLKAMSFRAFAEWASPSALTGFVELQEVEFSIRRGDLVVDGLTIATLKDDIPEEEKNFLSALIKKGYSARKGNMIPLVLPVYDQGEARAMENALKKYRSNK
jgi:hypothetical protein